MSIATECPDCFRTYNLPDKYAGKSIRCKSCGGAIQVDSQDESLMRPQPAQASNWPPPAQASGRSRAPRRRNHAGMALPDPIFWLIALGVAAFIVVGLVVSILAPTRGMLVALGLFITALVAYGVGKIILIVTGFMEDVPQGLLVLLVPFYWLSYVFSRQPRTKLAGQIILIGLVAALGTPVVVVTSSFVGGYRGAQEVARRNQARRNRHARGNAIQGTPIVSRPAAPDDDQRPRTQPSTTPPMTRNPFLKHSQKGSNLHTRYLTDTNHFFSPEADNLAKIEALLLEREGYVPGSAKLDLEAGTFTFNAPPDSYATLLVYHDLFRVGLISQEDPPTKPWSNPTFTSGR